MPSTSADTSSEERVFASREVCQIARITARQLQWWDERNVASPHQKGHRRIYLTEDVIGIMVIAELRRKGFSLQKIRGLVRFLRREIGRRLARIAGIEVYLLTGGESIHLEEGSARIIELFKRASHPMFLVSVTEQARRLAEFQKAQAAKNGSQRPEDQLRLF